MQVFPCVACIPCCIRVSPPNTCAPFPHPLHSPCAWLPADATISAWNSRVKPADPPQCCYGPRNMTVMRLLLPLQDCFNKYQVLHVVTLLRHSRFPSRLAALARAPVSQLRHALHPVRYAGAPRTSPAAAVPPVPYCRTDTDCMPKEWRVPLPQVPVYGPPGSTMSQVPDVGMSHPVVFAPCALTLVTHQRCVLANLSNAPAP